jgi:rhomboid protease GluP
MRSPTERSPAVGRGALTIAVVSVTSLITCASLLYPGILLALQRSPAALGAGQVWRLITPLFVERGGWKEIAFNLASVIAVGIPAERLWGARRWVIFYLSGGVMGETCGLAWRPIGAGSSVAVCGLLGACALWALSRRTSWLAVMAGMLTIVTGVVLTFMHDLHGPSLLVGALVAGVATRKGQP